MARIVEAAAWPLVGRAGELEAVSAAIDDPAAGCVVIAGAAGVGKSRLARECAQRASECGLDVGLVLATRAASGVPLGAFGALLPASGMPAGRRVDDLLRSAAATLRATDARDRVVLVDDAQHLDDTSAALALHLVTTRTAFVVATVRLGDPCPDAVASLWKEDLGPRLDLQPLDDTQIAAALQATLGGPVEQATLRVLARRCAGNMLFLTELVRSAREQGALEVTGGAWRLTGPLAPSQRLAELVDTRLGALDEDEREALQLVALGEPLGLNELTVLTAEPVLEALERRGLLAVARANRRTEVTLAHPLHGEVLRSRLGELRARSLARGLADAVAATGARRTADLLRVAVWRLDSGAPGDPELLADAAEVARARFDIGLAERLALAALDAGGGFRAGLIAGEAAINLGRPAEAEERLAALVPLARTDAERGHLASVRMVSYFLWLGSVEAALTIGEEALASIDDAGWRADVRAAMASALLAKGEIDDAIATLALALAEPAERSLHILASVAGLVYSNSGALERAVAFADEAERAEAVATVKEATPTPPAFAFIVRCQALAHMGRIAEARAEFERGHAATLDDDSPIGQAWIALAAARTLDVAGDAHAAAMWGREGMRILQDHSRNPAVGRYLSIETALALALCGHADEAQRLLEDSEQLAPWAGVRDVDRLVAQAWIAVGTGRLRTAAATLLAAVELSWRQGTHPSGLVAAHDLARIGDPAKSLELIEPIAALVDGELAPARVAHVRALVDEDSHALLAACDEFERLGTRLLAAEAAADAAVAFARRREKRAAAAAARRAHQLADGCNNPKTPALASLSARAELTRAEREIATLAATGHANREIAQQLFLSVRTVENTLGRVYLKLGITARTQLPDALGTR
jgi:DNA-binding NarL/FixJ family response regulator